LEKIDNIIPIFYIRGYNPPYTEGHIQVVRGIVKGLLLQNIRSVVFNYKYNIEDQNVKHTLKNGEDAGEVKFEQNIPLIDREDIFHQSIKSKIVYASLMETLATPRFLSIERCMCRHRRCVVNIINCFRYPRIFAKKFSTLPVVLHLYKRKIIMKNTTKMIIDKADMVITSSKTLTRHLEKNYGIDKLKIQTLYPPVDTEVYKPMDKSQSRRKLALKRSAKLLLYVGNLRKHRFPEDITLRLMKKLVKKDPQIKLLVFSPKNHENMKRKAEILAKASAFNLRQNIKINVRNLSEVEKSIIYSASDIFLFPPLKSGDSVEPPVTVLEAMSCGLPVISRDVNSISEIITDEVNGLIMPFGNGDPSILEEQISSLLEDNYVRMEFSYNARRVIIEKLSLHNSCQRLMGIFRSLSESKSLPLPLTEIDENVVSCSKQRHSRDHP